MGTEGSTRDDDDFDASRWRVIDTCGCCHSPASVGAGKAQGVELRRCTKCNTLRFSRVENPEVIYRDGYHSGDLDYGFDFGGDLESAYELSTAATRLSWIEEHGPRPPGRMVDVGGGMGFFAGAAAARGWKAELVEPVASAAAHASEKFGVTTHVDGVEALVNSVETYDLITFVHCVEHLPEARALLDALRERLALGGMLYVEVPNYQSMARRGEGDSWMGWQAGEHVYLFDKATLGGLLNRAGFDIVASGTFVPIDDHVTPDGAAHFLGISRLLRLAISSRRKVAGVTDEAAGGAVVGDRHVARIGTLTGLRRRLFGDGFGMLARAESMAGVGTNLRVLARPRPR